MKYPVRIIFIAVLLHAQFGCDHVSPGAGGVMDSYKKINVMDNGRSYIKSHGKNYAADGYYFGQKWQCVEYVKRFYKLAKHHEMPDVYGHARHFFDMDLPDGGFNRQRGLWQFRNGSVIRPAMDDILVLDLSSYGHVGIVTKVGPDFVEIIQQNIPGSSRQRYRLDRSGGGYYIRQPHVALGWLRLPATAEDGSTAARVSTDVSVNE